jgi:hypothetical protein
MDCSFWLGAFQPWGVDSESRTRRGHLLPGLQAHGPAMGRKAGVLEERQTQGSTAAVHVLRNAEAGPGRTSYATVGNSAVPHLTDGLLVQSAGVAFLHVPCYGAAITIANLMGGQVAMVKSSGASVDPMQEPCKPQGTGEGDRRRLPAMGQSDPAREHPDRRKRAAEA